MIITKEWLKINNACSEGMEYCGQEGLIGLSADIFVDKLINLNKLSWANWLIARALQKFDKVRYAAYAAEQVLPIFEKEYPGDDRPKNAIAAAKAYADYPCADTARAADTAARAADTAYAAACAADTAYAAAYAAHAASRAAAVAFYAARADADAARVEYIVSRAADTAYVAADTDYVAAGEETYIKIIRYGINLLC